MYSLFFKTPFKSVQIVLNRRTITVKIGHELAITFGTFSDGLLNSTKATYSRRNSLKCFCDGRRCWLMVCLVGNDRPGVVEDWLVLWTGFQTMLNVLRRYLIVARRLRACHLEVNRVVLIFPEFPSSLRNVTSVVQTLLSKTVLPLSKSLMC